MITICSYKRSGTHFLAATIHRNFELPDTTISTPVHGWKKFVVGDEEYGPGSRAIIPWGGLCGNHNTYNPAWIPDSSRLLYIYRHPIPTLISNWRIHDPFLEKDPWRYLNESVIDAWRHHVHGFTQNCVSVRYEDLLSDRHDSVLTEIGSAFGLTPKRGGFERVTEQVGWYPSRSTRQPKIPPNDFVERAVEVLSESVFGYDVRVPNPSFWSYG